MHTCTFSWSKFWRFVDIINLDFIWVKAHALLKLGQILMFPFRSIGNFELRFLFFFLMFLWVPSHVNSLSVGEEQALEVSLELRNGKCFNHFDWFFLSIEVITVIRNFLAIDSTMLFLKVLILFRNDCEDGIADSVETSIIHCLNFLSLWGEHSVHAVAKVWATLFLWLYHDPEAHDASDYFMPWENDVSKLLDCSQLIEQRFVQVLGENQVEESVL